MACVDIGPSNLKVVFNQGWFCPQRTFPRCLEKQRSPQLWGRCWHLVVIGQRDCEHPAVRAAAPQEPSNVNSTQSGRPHFTPMCLVAGFSLRDSLIHCPLKHPLFTPNGRSSLIYMCEVTSFWLLVVCVFQQNSFIKNRKSVEAKCTNTNGTTLIGVYLWMGGGPHLWVGGRPKLWLLVKKPLD